VFISEQTGGSTAAVRSRLLQSQIGLEEREHVHSVGLAAARAVGTTNFRMVYVR